MDVIIDGERGFEPKEAPGDLLELVRAVSDLLRSEKRGIIGIKVNGQDITPENFAEALEGKAAAEGEKVEVTSQSVPLMVENILDGLSKYLPDLPVACRSLAELFHGEKPEEGYEPFVELANIWSFIKSQEALVAGALELEVGELELDGVSLGAMHEDLNRFLEEAAEALENGDCVLLGDLLQYELAPRAEKESAIVDLLRSQSPGNPG